jgi:hypothetical protein
MCGSTLCNILLLRFLIVRCIEKKSLFIFRRNSRNMFPLFFLLHGIGDFVFSVLKVTMKNSSVGNDLPITVLACSVLCFSFTGIVLYYMVLLNFLKGYTRMINPVSREKVEKRFSLFKKVAWLLIPIMYVVGLLMVTGLKYSEYRIDFAMIYLIGGGICTLLFGILWLLTFGFLIKELANHIKLSVGSTNDIKVVYFRLKAAYYIGSVLMVTIAVFYIMFGLWSFLRIRSEYMILLIQIVAAPTFTSLVLTVSRINHKDQISPDHKEQISPDSKIDKLDKIECIADTTGHEMALPLNPHSSTSYLETNRNCFV